MLFPFPHLSAGVMKTSELSGKTQLLAETERLAEMS